MGIERWFNVDKLFLTRVESNHIEFAVIPTLCSLADMYIAAHKVAFELVPFRNKLFKMVGCHNAMPISLFLLKRPFQQLCVERTGDGSFGGVEVERGEKDRAEGGGNQRDQRE